MPRPARPWFRSYSEALTSRKVQKLKPNMFKHWMNLLWLANIQPKRGTLPPLPDTAFALRMSEELTADIIEELVTLTFIDAVGDKFVMHDWDDWQYDSDAAVADPGTAGSIGNHKRWHVARGVVAPDCSFCVSPDASGDHRPDIAPISPDASPRIPKGIARGEERRGDTETETEIEAEGEAIPVVLPVIRAFERCFARALSPMEIENIRALEEEHPRDRIDYALREAADLNKRNVRYIKAICENQEKSGDSHEKVQRHPVGAGARGAQTRDELLAGYRGYEAGTS